MDRELAWLPLVELRRRILQGDVSPVEAARTALERAESRGRELRAFVTLDSEGALRAARAAEEAVARGRASGPLHGVPVTVKDLMLTRGMPTTGGSRALGAGLPGDQEAAVVGRLRRAGAVVIGKTNLNEFAYGVTGENAHFGDVPNPWDPARLAGGSSSGSAAALALGIGYGSVGTDTRGSIRIPAACCSVTGLKPTRGLVPTEGVLPLSWTLDHAGPMARSVEDAALLLGVMAGGRRGGVGRYAGAPARPVSGLRLGICPFFFEDVDDQVAAAVRQAVDQLAAWGLEVREVEVPGLDRSLRASAVIAAAEALVVHEARVRERPGDFGRAVLQRIEGARDLTATDLARALRVRDSVSEAYRRAFRGVDVMVGPTLPGLPGRVGSSSMRVGGGREEWIVDASCRLVAPQNMTGAPAISVPCGFSREGLPIGLQIWGPPGRDEVVLSVAGVYQRGTAWHECRPPASASLTSESPGPPSTPGRSR